jgi:serine/threonine protein phosphatase PrpC
LGHTVIQVFTHSEVGGHAENEDAFFVDQHPADGKCWICALADGQGGRSGGGAAARIAVHAVRDMVMSQPPNTLADSWQWERILQSADAKVAKDPTAGFTTLIGFCVAEDVIVGAANGDSAVAIFDVMRDCWEITANQFKNPPVGSGDARFVNFASELERPWMILAMSDGVWKYSRWEKIKEAGKSLRGRTLVDELVNSARLMKTGKLQDDFTIVVLHEDQ